MVGGSSGGSVEKSVEHLGSGATAGVKLGERSLREDVGEGRGGGGGKGEKEGFLSGILCCWRRRRSLVGLKIFMIFNFVWTSVMLMVLLRSLCIGFPLLVICWRSYVRRNILWSWTWQMLITKFCWLLGRGILPTSLILEAILRSGSICFLG